MELATEYIAGKSNIIVLRLNGRLDINSAEELAKVMNTHLSGGYTNIIVNLFNVVYIGSSGIKTLLDIRNRIMEKDGALILVAINSAGKKILKAMDIEPLFVLCSDEKEALRRLNVTVN